MPSRSSSRSSSYSSRPSYNYSSPKSPISLFKPSTQITSNHNQLHQPGFLSNIIQGFSLGIGQSIAMNMFRSDPKVTHIHETPQSNKPYLPKEYVHCMNESQNNTDTCKEYLE